MVLKIHARKDDKKHMGKKYLNIHGFLPKDVVTNSGDFIELIGDLTNDPNEIIVITQLGRKVYKAYVCHVSEDDNKKNIKPKKCILDMPNFPKINIAKNSHIKTRENVKYTMACKADKKLIEARTNWLY